MLIVRDCWLDKFDVEQLVYKRRSEDEVVCVETLKLIS